MVFVLCIQAGWVISGMIIHHVRSVVLPYHMEIYLPNYSCDRLSKLLPAL
jgi:hypothetical protein